MHSINLYVHPLEMRLYYLSQILQMVQCGCEKSACKGSNCKCSLIGCTVFCACEAGPLCLNPLTKRSDIADETDEEADVEDNVE